MATEKKQATWCCFRVTQSPDCVDPGWWIIYNSHKSSSDDVDIAGLGTHGLRNTWLEELKKIFF